MGKSKPLIGITSYYVPACGWNYRRPRTRREQDVMILTMDYSRAVKAAGGIPVVLPVINDADYASLVLTKIDGLIMAGGPDISPEIYGEEKTADCGLTVPERDEFEISLLEEAISREIAVFGICRGYQLMNIYFGGTLYQDIYSQGVTDVRHSGFKDKNDIAHCVKISRGRLLEAYHVPEFPVNSFHHQAVKTLGSGLKATALSDDGLVEGFEYKDGLPLFGVQWHPEMMFEKYALQLEVFRYFIELVSGKN